MERHTAFAPLQQILDTFLNAFQDWTRALRVANDAQNKFTLLATGDGENGVLHVPGDAVVASRNLRELDTRYDWRDRVVFVKGVLLYAIAVDPGNALDRYDWAQYSPVYASGYTGTGGLAYDGGDPAVGKPPLEDVVAGPHDSYRVTLPPFDFYLYAAHADGHLHCYNGTTRSYAALLHISMTPDVGGH